MYQVEYLSQDTWVLYRAVDEASTAIRLMVELDTESAIDRRVLGPTAEVVVFGRHCSHHRSPTDIRPSWIILSMDKGGASEGYELINKSYRTKAAAVEEAKRRSLLDGSCPLGVLELVHVVGWIDVDIEKEIPF